MPLVLLYVLACLVALEEVSAWCHLPRAGCHGQSSELVLVSDPPEFFKQFTRRAQIFRFVDWDGDGDIDALRADYTSTGSRRRLPGRSTGKVYLHRQTEGVTEMQPLTASNLSASQVDCLDIADWDGDGDLDLIFLDPEENEVVYMESMLVDDSRYTAIQRHLILRTNLSHDSSFNNKYCDALQAVDWDQDGDLDLFFNGRYFERVSITQVVERTGHDNPLREIGDQLYILPYEHWPEEYKTGMYTHFVDWDSDGDLDVLLGGQTKNCRGIAGCQQVIRYFEQMEDGRLFERTGQDNPFHHIEIYMTDQVKRNPQVLDWSQTGIPGLILVDDRHNLFYEWVQEFYEVRRQSELVNLTGGNNQFQQLHLARGHEPHLVDWNHDGLMDLLTTDLVGEVRYFERSQDGGLTQRRFDFTNVTADVELWSFKTKPDAEVFHVGRRFRMAVADWDADGDQDLIVSTPAGTLKYLERQGDRLLEHKGSTNPFGEIRFNETNLSRLDERVIFSHVWQRPLEQPLVVDWDGDGDLDFMLGPSARCFERLNNGSLVEWVTEDCPFWNASQKPYDNQNVFYVPGAPYSGTKKRGTDQLWWKVLDCDGDGDLDLARIRVTFAEYRGFDEGTLESCERLSDGSLDCGTNMSCAPGLVFAANDIGLLDIADWNNDGSLEVVNVDARGVTYWKAGLCVPEQPCNLNGVCSSQGYCSCVQGYENGDCSGCMAGYYSDELHIFGLRQQCKPCSGMSNISKHSVCFDRGVCYDDVHVRRSSMKSDLSNTTLAQARGNGSCFCSEVYFGGEENGKISCGEGTCPAGFEEVRGAVGLQVCQPCQGGRASPAPGRACGPCPSGRASSRGSSSCRPCSDGFFASDPESKECQPCPAGTFSLAGSTICEKCPMGAISAGRSGKCHVCSAGPSQLPILPMTADADQQACLYDPVGILFVILVIIFATCGSLLFFRGLRTSIPIVDISMQAGQIVVTTQYRHRLLSWPCIRPRVHLSGTGVPDLDSPGTLEPYKVQALGIEQMVLIHPEGKTVFCDTSCGSVWLPAGMPFLITGFLGIPLLAWVLLSAGAAVTCATMSGLVLITSPTFLGILAAIVLLLHGYLQLAAPLSPLAKRRRLFLEQLKLARPKGPTRCPNGPHRAITVRQLCDLLEFFQPFILERSMYYVNWNLVMPLTKSSDPVSYAELVGPSRLQWFVSHFWGTPVRHFVASVRKHSESVFGPDWGSAAYWVCTFANNQWDVSKECGDGDWRQSAFYLALVDPNCRGTAMVLDDKALPLTRAWCLFELLQTLLLSQAEAGFTGLHFCTSTGVLNQGQASNDVAMATARRLASLDVRNAKASVASDQEMILHLVEQYPGGFAAVNGFVRASIRDCLMALNQYFQSDFNHLVSLLDAGIPEPTQPLAATPATPSTLTDGSSVWSF